MEDLNVHEILSYFVKKIWVIGTITVLTVLIGLIYSIGIKVPMY